MKTNYDVCNPSQKNVIQVPYYVPVAGQTMVGAVAYIKHSSKDEQLNINYLGILKFL